MQQMESPTGRPQMLRVHDNSECMTDRGIPFIGRTLIYRCVESKLLSCQR